MTLTELLMCLALYSIAGLMAIRLFDQSMHIIHAGAQDPTLQLDQMARALRVDAWSAKRIDITGNAADITSADATRIHWQWDKQQITRTETKPGAVTPVSRQWTTPTPFTPQPADRALILRTDSDQWRFTAPMLSEGSP